MNNKILPRYSILLEMTLYDDLINHVNEFILSNRNKVNSPTLYFNIYTMNKHPLWPFLRTVKVFTIK